MCPTYGTLVDAEVPFLQNLSRYASVSPSGLKIPTKLGLYKSRESQK